MKITLKDLYDFNIETGLVDNGFIDVETKNGIKKIQAIDITAKNSKKLKIKTQNFEILVSPEHLLYRNDWISSNNLLIGDHIDTINNYEKIISIEKDDILEDLYDIQVDGNEFYANGIRSHNSSLLESIDFTLFNIVRGKNTKRVPNYILPNRRNKNLETEVDFTNWKGDRVIINRKLNPKNFTIKINDIDRTSDYDLMDQKQKDDILGIEYNTYKSLISLNLADFANFINLDTETKKRLLNKMFNIEEIDGYLSLSKELLKNLFKRKEKTENHILTNINTIDTYKSNIDVILEKSGTISKSEIKEKVLSYKSTYILLENEIKELNNSIHSLNPSIESMKEVYVGKKNKIAQDDFNITELGKKINIFKDGNCPFCGTLLTDDVHMNELETLMEEYEESSKDMLELKRGFNKLKEEINSKITEKRRLNEEKEGKRTELESIKNELKSLKESYQNNIESVSIEEINKNIKSLQIENEKHQKTLEKIENKIEKYQKLVDVLSEKGIRKGIINNIVDPINEHLAKYLVALESKYNVKLNNEFDAEIKERFMEDIHVESLSTGEARKVNVAIALSYMEIMLSMNNKTNILFMDEVFASVDSDNIDLMLKVLRTFAEKNNISVIIVNHSKFDVEKFDRYIQVELYLGFSQIKEKI